MQNTKKSSYWKSQTHWRRADNRETEFYHDYRFIFIILYLFYLPSGRKEKNRWIGRRFHMSIWKIKSSGLKKKPLLFRGNTSNYKITTAYGGCRCDAIYLFKQSIDFKFVKKSLFPPLDKSDTKCKIFFHLNNDNISCARIALCCMGVFAFLGNDLGPTWPEARPRCRSPPLPFR